MDPSTAWDGDPENSERIDDDWFDGAVTVHTAEWLRLSPASKSIGDRGHTLVVTRAGSGSHMIDFVDHAVSDEVVVHARPDQIQRFDPDSSYDALVLHIRADVCPDGVVPPGPPVPVVPLGAKAAVVRAVIGEVAREANAAVRSPRLMVAGAQYVLELVANLASSATASDAGIVSHHHDLFVRFVAEVDQLFAESRNVAFYAQRIGASPKTLTRAAVAETGLGPKAIIDQRVALEAKRRLVTTSDSVAVLADNLGFPSTNTFNKFFQRLVGTSPGEFRSSMSSETPTYI